EANARTMGPAMAPPAPVMTNTRPVRACMARTVAGKLGPVRLPRWGLPLVAVVAVAAHATSLGDGFVFDDARAIVGNPSVQEPLSTALVTRDFWGERGVRAVGTWRPLVTLDFWIDRKLGGGAPWLF